MTFDVLGPPKNLLGGVSLERTEHLLHFFGILSRPLTFSIQPQIQECLGDSDVPKFPVWRNQMLLVWTSGCNCLGGPKPSAPTMKHERGTSFHQDKKSAACLTSPPEQERKNWGFLWGGAVSLLTSTRGCVTGGPVPVPSPVIPVLIYWWGGEQTLTRDSKQEQRNVGMMLEVVSWLKSPYFSSSVSGSLKMSVASQSDINKPKGGRGHLYLQHFMLKYRILFEDKYATKAKISPNNQHMRPRGVNWGHCLCKIIHKTFQICTQ